MDDDIDDLLNEVESKFCAAKKGGARQSPPCAPWPSQASNQKWV